MGDEAHDLHNNNRVCDALPDGDPAISGAGVAILGADHITIRHNTVTANRPAADSAFAGGIIVGSTPTPSGDRPSNNITVTKNEAEAQHARRHRLGRHRHRHQLHKKRLRHLHAGRALQLSAHPP